MKKNLVTLKPVEADDADELFPLVYKSKITDTIMWDGPDSLDALRSGLGKREILTKEGQAHQFTIIESTTGKKIGSIDVRPYEGENFRGDMGMWIGLPFQGKGLGQAAIHENLRYAFEKLKMEKLEAEIFVGNMASRKAFEKCGFVLEGTIRKAILKRGKFLDKWVLGITKEDYFSI
jgi:[ribosomal protein S5]-alanine N-acetyltransferase